jgi:nucleoside-diphosphate-sugar epimerase
MKIVVTGAAGRVGRATLAELQAHGHEAWAVDRTLPPAGTAKRAWIVDLTDAGAVYAALAGADAVIHLGAYPNTSFNPPERVFVNNTAACANVAAACGALGIRRVAYASSVTIYSLGKQARDGAITALPTDETVPHRPQGWYPLSKWVGEETFSLAAEQYGLAVASLRLSLVIGPDEYAERGKPRGRRDASGGLWGYVDSRDVAQAARLAVEKLPDLGAGNHAFNVGAADAHSELPLADVIPQYVPQIAHLAAGLTGTAPAFGIDKTRRLLGYEPRHSWRDAVAAV